MSENQGSNEAANYYLAIEQQYKGCIGCYYYGFIIASLQIFIAHESQYDGGMTRDQLVDLIDALYERPEKRQLN